MVTVGKSLVVIKNYADIQFIVTPCSFIIDVKGGGHSKSYRYLLTLLDFSDNF